MALTFPTNPNEGSVTQTVTRVFNVDPATGLPIAAGAGLGGPATLNSQPVSAFFPSFAPPPIGSPLTDAVYVDEAGALITRGGVTTDEGSVRLNFSGAALTQSLGSATFTNGSANVQGTGFLTAGIVLGDYVKLTADADSAWAQIDTIVSATLLVLKAVYTGTGGTGASSFQGLAQTIAASQTVTVSAGNVALASGTTALAATYLTRSVDFGPLVAQAVLTLSQRIANNTFYFGLQQAEAVITPRYFARFRFDGTVNTTVVCETGWAFTGAPAGGDLTTTTPTLPGAVTTAAAQRYRIEVLPDRTRFLINGVQVAEHFVAMPKHYDKLALVVSEVNGAGAPATTTTFTVGTAVVLNIDALNVTTTSDAPQYPVLLADSNGVPRVQRSDTSGNTISVGAVAAGSAVGTTAPALMGGSDGTNVQRLRLDTTGYLVPTYAQAAHAANIAGNPARLAGRALSADYTAVATGQTADLKTTLVGALINKPWAIPEADWSYPAAAGGIANSVVAVTVKAAAAAGLRNYVTSLTLQSEALTTATEFAIRDGAAGTVLFRIKITAAGIPAPVTINFMSPLRGSAATLLEVVTLTASVAGAVYANLSGYVAP